MLDFIPFGQIYIMLFHCSQKSPDELKEHIKLGRLSVRLKNKGMSNDQIIANLPGDVSAAMNMSSPLTTWKSV